MPPRAADAPPKIGLISATCLVIANMVGAGVFTTSGYALLDLGHPRRVMLAWAVGGIIACCGAISYGALVQRITKSGGEYIFLAEVFHPFAGFLAGWVSLLAGFTGAIAFAATSLEAYVYPSAGGWVAVAFLVGCGALHAVGLRVGALGQNAIVATKLVLVAGFVVWGAVRLPELGTQIDLPAQPFSIRKWAMALVWISLSYSGFNAAVYIASEVRRPQTFVPRALLWGTVIVTLGYLALNAIFVYTPPASFIAGKSDVAAASAEVLGGQTMAAATRLLVGLALASSISSMVMVAPRVYAKMAEDGLFPAWFSLEPDNAPPRAAIGLQVALASIVCLVSGLQDLLDYLGLTLSLCAAASVAGLLWLRCREGRERVPIPGGLLAPGIYIIATLLLAGLAASLRPMVLLGPGFTLLSGWIAYSLFHRQGLRA